MKKLIGLLAAVLLLATAGYSQTNTPPANPGSFVNTVQSYFTSFNTNLDGTFASSKGSLWTGVNSIQGGSVNLANEIGLSYTIYKQVAAENVVRNSGVAGTLVSEQIGLNLGLVVHDTRLAVYADGGYQLDSSSNKNTDKFYAELGLRAEKALSEHTFAWVGIGAQLPKNTQVFSAGAGFTF